MPADLTIVILFSIATAIAIVVRAWKVPYSVVLVVAGMLLGPTHIIDGSLLRRDILFSVFLPGLVFEASYQLDLHAVRKQAMAIVALAVPGVVVGMGLTASVLVLLTSQLTPPPMLFGEAIVFSAIIAATDPIAVVALFRATGAPGALGVLIEGESLLNDATAIALFATAVGWISGGTHSASSVILEFTRILAVGALIGATVGSVTSAVSHHVDDPMIEIALTTIAAYGAFALAEHAGASGVIATVTAGMICGSYGKAGMRDRTRHAVSVFWEYVAFAFNSVVFLLMGFSVHATTLLGAWRGIALAYVASVLGRIVVVTLVKLLLGNGDRALSWPWASVLAWGGVRGALSMVLALSLPSAFPQRDTIIAMTYGVVLLSLVVQGTSVRGLMGKLGVGVPERGR